VPLRFVYPSHHERALGAAGKIDFVLGLKGRIFGFAVQIFDSCHHEPASAGEGSAVIGSRVIRRRLRRDSIKS
jgi:hypothetical protein